MTAVTQPQALKENTKLAHPLFPINIFHNSSRGVNLYRVNQAEKLLRSTVVPITEISEQVGFCNINYFDKVFKQYKMYSP
jgi:YesN/AraC family two-component response regulator